MDRIERLRKEILKLKIDTETQGALNLIVDVMEDYRDNEFVQRLINHYWQLECHKEHPDA